MSIGKKHITRYYTIIEVMMAMGIFLIMMTIMMQFFTSAQKVWSNSAKRNMLYSDARVAMNLMTREIQSILFRNTDTDGSAIYPFWYEWQDITQCANAYDDIIEPTRGTVYVPTEIKDYYTDVTTSGSEDLSIQGNGEPYVTALNFISTTDLKPVDEGSDVCEIRYRFVPVYSINATPSSPNDIKGGKLRRSCTAEYSPGSPPTATSSALYNFAANPYLGASTPTSRITTIWNDSTSSAGFETVINGVYSLSFTCYKWDSSTNSLAYHQPIDSSGYGTDGQPKASSGLSPALDYDLATGTPCPVAIRIDMKLMDPKDLKRLAYYIYVANDPGSSTGAKEDAKKQVRSLKQKMRTFSKVIYLGKRED